MIREKIIQTLKDEDGPLTTEEILDRCGLGRKQAIDNLRAAVQDGLIERLRDDVTGNPAYRLTEAGHGWQPQKTLPAKPHAPANPPAQATRYYAVILIAQGYDTIQQALAEVAKLDVDEWEDVRIIEGRIAGRIVAQAALVDADD